jgi:DNA-binding response OmpR family regulator
MSSTARKAVVLLVEDEVLIQDLVQTALEEGGFEVLVADDGARGLELIEDRAEILGGLVTDINLGRGPSGWDVARRGRELNGRMPVVYVSGDSAHEWASRGVPQSVMITKPFAPAQILVALASLANSAEPPV